MSDSEAWCELCDMYIAEQEYSKAAFCMEELILANPHVCLCVGLHVQAKSLRKSPSLGG